MIEKWYITKPNGKAYPFEISLILNDNQWILDFPYDKDLIAEVKNLKGARWNTNKYPKQWIIDDCERNDFTRMFLCTQTIPLDNIKYDTQYNPQNPLMVHQQLAFIFTINNPRSMLAMDMGTGKTLVAITLMEYAAINEKAYHWWVVAPTGALKEWERQLKKWNSIVTPEVMTTYESLHHHMEMYSGCPDGVIFDESIKIKTPQAQRSQIAYELCRILREQNKRFVLLSGSPAPKDPTDWWHQLECIQPGFIKEPNVHKFRERYADIIYEEGEFGKYPKVIGWKHDQIKKLGKRLAPLVFVKQKKDCFDLPDKIYDIINIQPTDEILGQARKLESICSTAIEYMELLRELSDGFIYYKDETGNRLTEWIHSKKLEIIKELLNFYSLENGGCGRLVIYAAHHATIDKIVDVCQQNEWAAFKIDGRGWSNKDCLGDFDDTERSIGNRQGIAIVANPGSVYGLNLTKTDALVYFSNNFSVDNRIQSIERRDRLGLQSARGTRIVDIVHLPTDKRILELLTFKIEIQSITLEEIKSCLKV